jgi:hypothetical protein
MDHITEAYSRHIRTLYKEQDPGVVIDFLSKQGKPLSLIDLIFDFTILQI